MVASTLHAAIKMEVLIWGLLAICTFSRNEAADWSYEGDLGPKYWNSLFPDACSGRQQSPIDIVSTATQYDPKLNDFAIWHDPPKPGSKFKVHNNGHSITVSTMGPFHVTNGGLPSIYSTAQFHFHWGHANHQGSEHLIDNKASPLELHIVNWDSEKYQSISMAMVEPMGLAVLGVMYEVGDKDNEALEPIIQAMKHVEDPEHDIEHMIMAQSLRDFLPDDTSKYYRYNGSLTTPGCFESVIWTVFDEPKYISHRQMMAFRRVLQNKPKHGKKHHKRSTTKEEKVVREVMEEAGIDDTLQKMELEMALEEHKDKEASLGEPPKKFYLHHGENPDTDNMKKVNQSGAIHYTETEAEKRMEELIIDLEHENKELVEEIDRLKLVNNFRPVQPLNDRIVYRSFTAEATMGEEPAKVNQMSSPCNHGNYIVISWSIVLLCGLLAFL